MCFLLPYLAWAFGGFGLDAAAGAILILVLTRGALALRFGHAWSSVVLHPAAIVALLAFAADSARWAIQKRIEWRGRVYTPAGDTHV